MKKLPKKKKDLRNSKDYEKTTRRKKRGAFEN